MIKCLGSRNWHQKLTHAVYSTIRTLQMYHKKNLLEFESMKKFRAAKKWIPVIAIIPACHGLFTCHGRVGSKTFIQCKHLDCIRLTRHQLALLKIKRSTSNLSDLERSLSGYWSSIPCLWGSWSAITLLASCVVIIQHATLTDKFGEEQSCNNSMACKPLRLSCFIGKVSYEYPNLEIVLLTVVVVAQKCTSKNKKTMSDQAAVFVYLLPCSFQDFAVISSWFPRLQIQRRRSNPWDCTEYSDKDSCSTEINLNGIPEDCRTA